MKYTLEECKRLMREGDGDLTLSGHVDSLPDNLLIEGNLAVSDDFSITEWPKGMHVLGNVNFDGIDITSLPPGMFVEGNLYVGATEITSIPDDITVLGMLDLFDTDVSEIPSGVRFGGLNIMNTRIRELPDKLHLPQGLALSGGYIDKLPEDLIVGHLVLDRSRIRKLPDNLIIERYLNIAGSDIKKLPKKLVVGGTIEIDDTGIKRIPADLRAVCTYIYDDAGDDIDDSKVKKLKDGEYVRGRYLYTEKYGAFPISQKCTRGRYTIYHGKIENQFIIYDGEQYIKCRNIDAGMDDLRLIRNEKGIRDGASTWGMDTIRAFSVIMDAYRVITRASHRHVECIVDELGGNIKTEYTLREAIDIIDGHFNASIFKSFFTK